MSDNLNEIQGPFLLQSEKHVLHCDDQHFVNKNLATEVNGKYQCTGQNLVFGSQSVCDIFDESSECKNLKNDYRKHQKKYLSIVREILQDQTATLQANNLERVIFKVATTTVGEANLVTLTSAAVKEVVARLSHRRLCVCVADNTHMGRISLLKKMVSAVADRFVKKHKVVMTVQTQHSFSPIYWLSSVQMGGVYTACAYTSADDALKSQILEWLEETTVRVWTTATGRTISVKGQICFDGDSTWGWMDKLWKQKIGDSFVIQDIHKIVKQFLVNKDSFRDGAGCVDIENGEIVGLHLNPNAICEKLFEKTQIFISPKWLVKLDYPTHERIIDTCIDGFLDFQLSRKTELCNLLPKLNNEIASILRPYCHNGGGGGPADERKNLIRLSEWTQPAATNRMMKKLGIRTSGNISQDISNLTLAQVRKLVVLIEKELSKTHRKVAWGYRTTTSTGQV